MVKSEGFEESRESASSYSEVQLTYGCMDSDVEMIDIKILAKRTTLLD